MNEIIQDDYGSTAEEDKSIHLNVSGVRGKRQVSEILEQNWKYEAYSQLRC
jgi:hypothetical protein